MKLKLTPGRTLAMRALYEAKGPLSRAELAEASGLSLAAISDTIQLSMGMIRRTSSDNELARYEMTEEGKAWISLKVKKEGSLRPAAKVIRRPRPVERLQRPFYWETEVDFELRQTQRELVRRAMLAFDTVEEISEAVVLPVSVVVRRIEEVKEGVTE
jgi:DNA-binding Lrp family transcriptional regulator